jgi:hypothetical protein
LNRAFLYSGGIFDWDKALTHLESLNHEAESPDANITDELLRDRIAEEVGKSVHEVECPFGLKMAIDSSRRAQIFWSIFCDAFRVNYARKLWG